MQNLTEILLGGLSQGAVYCVIAVGLSLVYGAARILNFAHGSLYTIGGYIAWTLTSSALGLPIWAAMLVAVPVLFLVGVGLERIIIRPMRARENWKINTIMVTLGLAFALDNLSQIVFGPSAKTVEPFVNGTIDLFGVTLSLYKFWMFWIALALVAALEFFLSATRFGHAVRAVSQDIQGANQVGIEVNHVFAFSFGLSVVLTGLAGILLAPVFLVSPLGGWAPFLKAFVIVVFGGLGSTRGAFIAAFILGILESFIVYYLGAAWTMPIWLLMLLCVLMVRPKGLFGVWEN